MDLSRIKYLRGELEAECLSWGEVSEIESAFEEIDPTTLPEPAENAGWGDMLDELEARIDPALRAIAEWQDPDLAPESDMYDRGQALCDALQIALARLADLEARA